MAGTFTTRMRELRDRTHSGDGLLRGSVEFDQVYAHYQHERMDLHHTHGHAKYLERALFDAYRFYLALIARSYLEDGGHRAMAHCMEDLSDAAGIRAPIESGALARSGHPEVRRGEMVTYDRPPRQHRLTKPELQVLAARRLDRPGMQRLKGWIYWHNTIRGRMGLPPRRVP
jgi:hypothetical protein